MSGPQVPQYLQDLAIDQEQHPGYGPNPIPLINDFMTQPTTLFLEIMTQNGLLTAATLELDMLVTQIDQSASRYSDEVEEIVHTFQIHVMPTVVEGLRRIQEVFKVYQKTPSDILKHLEEGKPIIELLDMLSYFTNTGFNVTERIEEALEKLRREVKRAKGVLENKGVVLPDPESVQMTEEQRKAWWQKKRNIALIAIGCIVLAVLGGAVIGAATGGIAIAIGAKLGICFCLTAGSIMAISTCGAVVGTGVGATVATGLAYKTHKNAKERALEDTKRLIDGNLLNTIDETIKKVKTVMQKWSTLKESFETMRRSICEAQKAGNHYVIKIYIEICQSRINEMMKMGIKAVEDEIQKGTALGDSLKEVMRAQEEYSHFQKGSLVIN